MKNGKPNNLAARLERLEADVQEIKSMLQERQASKEPWWKPFVGVFENDPIADAARKITEQIREKERQKARRKRRTRKRQQVEG